VEEILVARGTQDGLVLRADGRASAEVLWDALRGFIQSRRSFVEGNQVIIEWANENPSDETVSFVRANVLRDFDIELINGGLVSDEGSASDSGAGKVDSRSSFRGYEVRSGEALSAGASSGLAVAAGGGPSLFGGIEAALGSGAGGRSGAGSAERTSGAKLGATSKVGWGAAVANWDDADARVVYGTLRSGQKVETEHSVVVFGDVNSGAEIVAGGDVVVLGNLRGVAHAGAYDETGGGRVIFALHLEPTQLRIGAVISRGMGGGSTPEIARVDGPGIVVEPYQAKGAPSGRRAA
jgi:septum formation inhibitor MinC